MCIRDRCNICPPSAAAALGRSYSVREGWLTGALNRYLADEEQDLELGICFPSEEEELSQFSGRIKLKELTDAPEAGGKEVYVYGFRENLKRPEMCIRDSCCSRCGVFRSAPFRFRPPLLSDGTYG